MDRHADTRQPASEWPEQPDGENKHVLCDSTTTEAAVGRVDSKAAKTLELAVSERVSCDGVGPYRKVSELSKHGHNLLTTLLLA